MWCRVSGLFVCACAVGNVWATWYLPSVVCHWILCVCVCVSLVVSLCAGCRVLLVVRGS